MNVGRYTKEWDAAIIAGGRGSRMGNVYKPLLEINGETILARQVAILRPMFKKLWLSVNEIQGYEQFGIPMVVDGAVFGDEAWARKGPMAGVASILATSTSQWVFVVAGDMPFINPSVIEVMAQRANTTITTFEKNGVEVDAVAVKANGYIQPLFTLYKQSCLPLLKSQIQFNNLSLRALLAEDKLCVNCVELEEISEIAPNLRFLRNVNTQKDLMDMEEEVL